MATPDERKTLKGVSGRLVVAPTDITTAFPHGGTALGAMAEIRFAPNVAQWIETAEEWGGQPVQVGYAGEAAVIFGIMRDYDSDSIAQIFPNSSEGSVSQKRVISQDAGGGQTITGKVLYFSPDAVDDHPGIYCFNAKPMLQLAAELRLKIGEEMGFPFVFHLTPDAQDRVYRIGRRKDIAALL